MQKIVWMFFIFCFLCNVNSLSLRGYSVVWRNSRNKIVKQVIYDKKDVFTPRFATELEELNELPTNTTYKAFSVNHINKLIILKTKSL